MNNGDRGDDHCHDHDDADLDEVACEFCAGGRAFESGLPATANPYPPPSVELRARDCEAYYTDPHVLWSIGYATAAATRPCSSGTGLTTSRSPLVMVVGTPMRGAASCLFPAGRTLLVAACAGPRGGIDLMWPLAGVSVGMPA